MAGCRVKSHSPDLHDGQWQTMARPSRDRAALREEDEARQTTMAWIDYAWIFHSASAGDRSHRSMAQWLNDQWPVLTTPCFSSILVFSHAMAICQEKSSIGNYNYHFIVRRALASANLLQPSHVSLRCGSSLGVETEGEDTHNRFFWGGGVAKWVVLIRKEYAMKRKR